MLQNIYLYTLFISLFKYLFISPPSYSLNSRVGLISSPRNPDILEIPTYQKSRYIRNPDISEIPTYYIITKYFNYISAISFRQFSRFLNSKSGRLRIYRYNWSRKIRPKVISNFNLITQTCWRVYSRFIMLSYTFH